MGNSITTGKGKRLIFTEYLFPRAKREKKVKKKKKKGIQLIF